MARPLLGAMSILFWCATRSCFGVESVPQTGPLFIKQYRVLGAHRLSKIEIERAVYPFLGPGRGPQDVEQARAALEKAYQAKGFQTVSVQVPQQQGAGGIVVLNVTESTVGRLRVRGSRYFLPSTIKKNAPALAEGSVPDFNEVTQNVVSLNQWPDRRVTPSLKAGVVPGTVDVDLTVEDTFPLHGSAELNNRYSANTDPLRVNASLSYNNLWQLGHTIGGSAQLSPEDISQVQVYSGYYVVRFADLSWLTLIAQGIKQDSNVSTLGSIDVAGKGEVIGGRAIITFPQLTNFFHSLTLGLDYKHFDQNVTISGVTIPTPVYYYPFSANYTATYAPKGSITNADFGVTFHARGMGSTPAHFDFNRFNADANFIYLRSDLSHQHDLPFGFQAYGKVQGQVSDQPLVNSEQFAGGGLPTARGYLEAEVLGDNGTAGTLELRSPNLLSSLGADANEGRIYVFADGAYLELIDPLPEQDAMFALASVGAGARVKIRNHWNGSIDAAVPFISQTQTAALDWRLTFRVWADF
ncbi:MAG TPA: ShlB/FhaC/HecB family hemolysin secretion/activation protein [Chthoniobacterales bacterium]|nr:ShlB/FhaC/HecB family hemolysin secretion/activation protein [Chthoniobacterales bacterium]